MESRHQGDAEKAMQDLGAVVSEGEEMLKEATGEGEGARELRANLREALDRAKALYEQLQERTVAAAKATDRAVREHPYQSVGVAFAVGLLIGVLASRRSRD